MSAQGRKIPKGLIRATASDMLLLGGAAAMIYGVSLVHVPAAWAFAGLLAALSGWLLGRSGTPG